MQLSIFKSESNFQRPEKSVKLGESFVFARKWILSLTTLFLLSAALCPVDTLRAQDPKAGELAASKTRTGYLIPVALPITETVEARVAQQIQKVAEKSPSAIGEDKPVLILDFDTRNGATGQGSDLGNCLDIALLLRGKNLQGLRTVAYIPRPRGFTNNDKKPISALKGHAVLIALACDEIAMHEEASFGQAGIDISGDPSLAIANYEFVVGRRRPEAFTRALVDKSRALFRVETLGSGIRYVDEEEKAELGDQISNTISLSLSGDLLLLDSKTMQQNGFIRNRVSSKVDLATRLGIDKSAVETNPWVGEDIKAVQLPINNFVDAREADWSLRMLNNHMASHPDTNLIIVRLNSTGGELEPCLRLARELAALDPGKIQTVAFVETSATGPTSLLGIACDRLIMASNATMSGSGTNPIEEQQLEDSRALIKRFAEEKQIDWSLPMGLVDPDLAVSIYKHRKGQTRILCQEELESLPNFKDWEPISEMDLGNEFDGQQAVKWELTRSNLDSFDQLKKLYQLETDPIELEPSPADRWIENMARELATPWLSALLLFGAVFLLSTEMSNPGIGIPGFLGTICLMLFFWSQYLDGNANWLEILLFVVGATFVLLEVFVIPGFGVFGIGGLLMVVASIVLASQTFIIPSNSEELARLPVSLSLVLAASFGFFAGIFFIRKYLTTMPMFRRIMLNPPSADQSVSPNQREQRESLVDRAHMIGKSGMAMTPLIPAGKAQIGNQLVDVITDGRMIESQTAVRVVEVVGNRVIVEAVEA